MKHLKLREVKRFAKGHTELGPEASPTPGHCFVTPSCLWEPNMILFSKMAITLYSFYKGIQPSVENLKTNTCENEINCKCSLQWKTRDNVYPLCHGHIRDPHNLLRDSTARGKHKLCSLIGKASILQGAPPLPPYFLVVEWVLLHNYTDERRKCMRSSVYNVVPWQMLVPFPFALTENTTRGPGKPFFNDNCLHLK